MEEEINLKGKMDDWGLFGKKEGEWLIFTIGNPEEGHGLALPRMIDDLTAKYIAHRVEFRTGSRYIAHIPYTTDRCGDAAKDWAPHYLPEDKFIQKTKEFLQWHLNIMREIGLKADKVLIIIGHGGNAELKDKKDDLIKELGLKKLILVSALERKYIPFILNMIEKYAEENALDIGEDPDEYAFSLFELLRTAGHAGHIEHSIAAAMNLLDYEKLEQMNQELSKDFDATLKKYPPIGGLGGFLKLGGKYTEALGTKENDKYSLWYCLESLENQGKIIIDKTLGEFILNTAIDKISEEIQNN